MPTWNHRSVAEAATRLRLAVDPRRQRQGNGYRLGSGAGNSLEFHDYRSYVSGDDPRLIDWGVYARSDQLVLRRHRQEISPRLEVFYDASASMALTAEKESFAATLCALILSLAQQDGTRASLWLCDNYAKPIRSGQWIPALQQQQSSGTAGLLSTFSELGHGSERILITDGLYSQGGPALVKHIGHGAGTLCCIQVLTQSEIQPQYSGGKRLEDVEGGFREIVIDDRMLDRYQQRFSRHQAAWQEALRGRGVGLITCVVEEGFQTALKNLLKAGVVSNAQ